VASPTNNIYFVFEIIFQFNKLIIIFIITISISVKANLGEIVNQGPMFILFIIALFDFFKEFNVGFYS
jgi:hypothetical protein